jgi:outer membrane receptor protein involved in Fe transport
MKLLSVVVTGLLLGVLTTAHAQTHLPIVYRGVVTDSLKSTPLSYVTLTLVETKTNAQVKSVLSKDNGTFEITGKRGTAYKLNAAYVGYKSKVLVLDSTKTNVGTILLAPSSKQLTDVSITASKPIIHQEVDRISYDVQSDPENKVTTVLDMLRKVPMVSVDGIDNIRLKGSGNYKILINGKESALIAKNPSDVFKAMPASNIEKIEVITTPPAKYDAEGLAGIINIITKKNADQGYNGSIDTRYNTVYGPAVNINATVKQGKFGLNGYLGFSNQNEQTTASGVLSNISLPIVTNSVQQSTNTRSGNNLYGSAELSYEIDTLNLVTGMFQHFGGNNNSGAGQHLSQYNSVNSLTNYYQLVNSGTSNYNGYDLGINYQLGFKHHKDQLLTASYKYITSSNQQNTDAQYLQNFNYAFPNYRQFNHSGGNEQTVQLDYVQPMKTVSIEAGAKGILRSNYSDFQNFTQDNKTSLYNPNTSQSNNFNYQQDIYSIYNSYQLKLKDWVAKGGLRYELTTISANFVSVGSTTNPQYNNLVPSVSVQHNLNKTNSLTFGYTERIQRPGIWQLNPFVDRSNPKFVNVGNPDLVPVKNHSFELNYSNFSKGSINISTNYSFANNTVENVLNFNAADTVTTTTYQNVGKNKRLGIDINANYPITNNLNININAELVHVWLEGTYNSQFYKNAGNQGHVFTYTSYKFKKDYNVGLNIGYDSRYVLLQGLDNDYFFYSLSGTKDILKKKATISLSVNNPFEKLKKLDYFYKTDNFAQSNYFQVYARQISVSFNYKFGRLNASIKKNQRGISNDDVSGGGGRH